MLKTVQDSLKKSPTTLKEIELKNQEVIAAQAEILISPLQIRGNFPRFLKAPLAAGLCEEMRKWGNDHDLGLFASGCLISSITNCQPFAWDSNLNEPIRPICRWPQFILRKLKLASNLRHGADLPYPARALPSSEGLSYPVYPVQYCPQGNEKSALKSLFLEEKVKKTLTLGHGKSTELG